MVSAAHSRASPRSRRSTRQKHSYRELTSDEESSDISPITSRISAVRSSTRVQRRSYKFDDDSSKGSQSSSDSDQLPRSPLRKTAQTSISSPPRQSARSPFSSRHERRSLPESIISDRGHVPRKRVKLSVAGDANEGTAKQILPEQVPVGKRIPPWQDLEYHILLQIFKYAAYPLYAGPSHSQPTIQWLLDVSLLSKSFRAAAIAALLHSPPLFPAERAHGLLRLLKQDQGTLSTNYKTKIREVKIEAKNLLVKKGGIVLQDLVGRHTPLLSELNIYHNFDLIGPTTWGRPSTSKRNWAYPPELFDALDDANICLKAFSWNGRFPETGQVLEKMASSHQRPCLHGLQSLSLLNMTLPEKYSDAEVEGLLTTALSYLPELKELSFENCGILNEAVLQELPHDLRHLTLTTCANVTSHGLGTFLQIHGHELRGLYLRGNQAMDLGYLPNLASTCPKLQTIEVDLTYTDPSSYHDIDPHYDELLPNGQPTWPSSLRVVEFANLRNLDAAEADGFFQSLVDSAHKLKELRRLSLKAILKVGWRDRARLREKWKMKLEKVFLRKSLPPTPFESAFSNPSLKALSSPPTARLAKSPPATRHSTCSTIEDSDLANMQSSTTAKNRKSSRIAQKELENLSTGVQEKQVTLSAGHPVASHGPMQPPQDDKEFVHGMVDEVILRLDDQRPSEAQFNEGDFLDSEQSDEDWDGT